MNNYILTVEEVFYINNNTETIIAGKLNNSKPEPFKKSRWECYFNGAKKEELLVSGEALTGDTEKRGLVYNGYLEYKELLNGNSIELVYLRDE